MEYRTRSQDSPRLEDWTLAPMTEHNAVVVMPDGQSDSLMVPAGDTQASVANLLALLIGELQATRAALAEAPAGRSSPDTSTSLRERLLDKQVRELQGRVQAMTAEIAALHSEAERKERERLARERRERMRSFSD
jgi:hypothetical protein